MSHPACCAPDKTCVHPDACDATANCMYAVVAPTLAERLLKTQDTSRSSSRLLSSDYWYSSIAPYAVDDAG